MSGPPCRVPAPSQRGYSLATQLGSSLRARSFAASVASLAFLGLTVPGFAAYTTPGTGGSYSLDDLVALSGGVVTGSAPDYQLHDSLILSTTDLLTIPAGTRVEIQDTAGTVRIDVNGSLRAIGALGDSIRFESATGAPGDWDGFDFRDTTAGSTFEMEYCVIEDATIAIDVVSADARLEKCAIRGSDEKAFDLTGSNSILRDSVLEDNERQTIYMTLSSSPVIEGNLIRRNNLVNSNPYPYINIGLQGVNSPTIRGNTILGGDSFRSGGISIWNDCYGVIEGNHIEGCGYGILCYQFNANPFINDNTIVDNDTNPDTVNWGFGIACNGENAPVIARNRIQGHNYGIAIINGGQPNVGNLANADPDDDGMNQFLGNGLGGTLYELYNNGTNDISAENNWWGTMDPQEVEDRIVHSVDDPLLGTVDFEPLLDVSGIADGSEEPNVGGDSGDGFGSPGSLPGADGIAVVAGLEARPNPTRDGVALAFRLQTSSEVEISVFSADGRRVDGRFLGRLPAGPNEAHWDGRDGAGARVPAGVYLWRATTPTGAATGKVQVVR